MKFLTISDIYKHVEKMSVGAGRDLASAQRIEKKTQDAMDSMERTRLEGWVEALAEVLQFIDDNDHQEITIGATADIRWKDSGEVVTRYFSFGDCPGESTHDEYGVPDENIFFYPGDTEGFEALCSDESDEDFVVLRDTVVWEVRTA